MSDMSWAADEVHSKIVFLMMRHKMLDGPAVEALQDLEDLFRWDAAGRPDVLTVRRKNETVTNTANTPPRRLNSNWKPEATP